MIDMLPCAAPRRVERGYIQSSVIVSAGAEIRDPGVLDQIPKDKFQIPERGDEVASAGNRSRWGGK